MAARRKRKIHPAQTVTTGSTLRMEPPRSSRQPQPKSPVIVGAEETVGGFFEFLREHAVVALALGFVVATQIQALARQLIASFIDPAFKLLGGQALSQRTFTLHFHDRAANFGWGSFVYSLMDVMFVLVTIYLIVKIFKLDKLVPAKSDDED